MASIKWRADRGKYQARYRDGERHEHAGLFARKADAQAWLDEQTASKVRGDWVDPRRSRKRFGEWAEQYLSDRVHLKPKTVADYESLLATCILPTWKDVPLLAVSNAEVVAWVAKLRGRPLSASRTRQAHHLFSGILDAAVRDKRLASNPAAGVDLPRLPHTEQRYLDHGQLADLAAACGPYDLTVFVLGRCGIRWGELAALRVGRVDLLNRRLNIVESMTEVRGEAVFGSPKSHRTCQVPFGGELRERLMVHVAGMPLDAFVFPAPKGGVLRVGNFRRGYFDGAARTAGLDGLTPHELRHTAASLAIAAGANVKVVQAMLGHASATQTLDRYGHLFGDDLDTVADRIETDARASLSISRTKRGPKREALSHAASS